MRNLAKKKDSSLPFAYFLENRTSFLESLTHRSKLENQNNQESRFMTLLQSAMDPKDNEKTTDNSMTMWNRFDGYLPNVTVQKMMSASMHLGHDTSYWNPKMKPFILGERAGKNSITMIS
jgi:hypothetical protein